MTLIFDSDEEGNHHGEAVETLDENEFGEYKNKENVDDYFLNEDSIKIEKSATVLPQLLSNNSFNADSSLMLLASNLANNPNNQDQIQFLQDQLMKKRSKSINSRNEKEDAMDNDKIKTVERQEFFNQLSQKKENSSLKPHMV